VENSAMHLGTMAIHGGHLPDRNHNAVATPIYATAAFEFNSADHAADLFNLELEGFRYSRINNPTVAELERRVAMLEGGVDALAVGSGQAALNYALQNLAKPGSNIVAAPQLYGTTHTLLAHLLPNWGVKTRFSDSAEPADIARLIDEDTAAVFCETICNPSGEICDLQALADAAHERGVAFVVDNTIATPMLLRPIEQGAYIVVHSLTKFMGGHGVAMGGAVVDSGNFDWTTSAARYPMMNQPDPSYHGLIYTEKFGRAAYINRCRSVFLRVSGATLAPLSAFLILQGIETLAVRMDRHVDNARHVAHFLRNHPAVSWVNYGGFADSVLYPAVMRYLGGRAPSVLTFGPHGGLAAAKRFYDALNLVKRVVNLGDVRSLACHPASTTHRQMNAMQQAAAGVLPDMVRLSVGIEQVEDILADIDQALNLAMQVPVDTLELA
jgi:O-acetylhomoserine (thiol)-lyase